MNKSSMRVMMAVALMSAMVGLAAGKASFEGAGWIWDSNGGGNPGAGQVFFRADLEVPVGSRIESAEVIVTADNLYALFINGRGVGESAVHNSAWQTAGRYDVSELLVAGHNVVAVRAVNTLPGPAGLLLKAEVRLADGRVVTLASDEKWRSMGKEEKNWEQLAFEDGTWSPVRLVAPFGGGAWGAVTVAKQAKPPGGVSGAVRKAVTQLGRKAVRSGAGVVLQEPTDDFDWPGALVFLGDDCSLYRPKGKKGTAADSLNVTIFNPRNSRAFPEHDLPAPMKVGRKLMILDASRREMEPRVLLDAGRGAIGSPSVSFDGKSVLVSMAREGDAFYHVYRVPATGGTPVQLTDGPFHDIDPAEMPDGRIVFTSTRIGTFEEYHNPPSRSLFVMGADGKDIRPLTHTPIFDNEPEVMADGRIIFIRSDNFFDRGKVETILHAIHPDGRAGQTEFGLENGPEYGNRLRAFHCGSPAPMPDGRVAFVSQPGVTVGRPGSTGRDQRHFRFPAGDVAALPDGRLLCTWGSEVMVPGRKKPVRDMRYRQIGVLDPDARTPTFTPVFEIAEGALHSPVYLGPRKRPPVLAEQVDPATDDDVNATGFLFCSNAKFTGNTTAGWSHVRAVRILAAKPLTVRSSHSYIVHAGTEVVELGTVPLAPDGSFHVEVPANTPLAIQAVDAEGRSELNEMSWLFVRPGEQRSCVGCHQPRQVVPEFPSGLAQALTSPPLNLSKMDGKHRFRGNNAAVTGLMELQFDRFREVAGLNRHDAGESLVSGTQEVEDLIGWLKAGSTGEKVAAAQRVAIFRDSAAAPELAALLRRPPRELGVAAAMALATCGDRDSVPGLLGALTHRDPVVAQAAAVALENLTGHRGEFDPFASATEKYRQAAAWKRWFAETGWDGIEAELVKRLDDPDRDVVRRAAVALGHTGGTAAGPALRRYVMKHRDINPLPEWRKKGNRGDRARFNAESPVNPRTLQAVVRALGSLRDADSIPMLEETVMQHKNPSTGNVFLAEAAIEALGRMQSPEADAALLRILPTLNTYQDYTLWYGDHSALMACHASPLHYFIAEALDAREVSGSPEVVPELIRSVPVDPDRALFLETDDCEELVGRVIRRNGAEAAVVETCLAMLGDPDAKPVKEIEAAVKMIHRCWAGHPTPENRAAQILSLVCRDGRYESRIRAAFMRYREVEDGIPRVFDTGIPVVNKLPQKHWVCFYLARTLGYLGQEASVPVLLESLEHHPTEAANGRPDPLGPGVLFLHNDLTPCWRAAVAWALGQLGDKRAVPVLLGVVADLENAPDTRHAAAEALGAIGDPGCREAVRKLAKDYPEVATRKALLRVVDSLE